MDTAGNDPKEVENGSSSNKSICWKGSSDETIFNGKDTFYFQVTY